MFTLAPKFSNACSMCESPILTEIMGHPASLYFTGVLFSMMELTYSVRNAFLSIFSPLFSAKFFEKLCIRWNLIDHI